MEKNDIDKFYEKVDERDFRELSYNEQLDTVRNYLGLKEDIEGVKRTSEFLNDITKYEFRLAALKAAIPAIMVRNRTKNLGVKSIN